MGIFSNLTNDGLEAAQDRVGGFAPFPTDAYDAKVKLAYAIQSDGGAHGVVLMATMPDGREYRETIYITNKKGENFFLNKDDKTKKVPLPGFTVVNDICLATTEAPLSEQPTEEKVVNIYDYDQKKELPKSVPVLTALIDMPVTLGIVEQLENKSAKDGAGNYQPTAETRIINFIDKVFHTETKKTMVEALNGQDAAFYDKWVERNQGQQRDKRTIKDGAAGTAGRPSAGPPTGGTGAKPKSLFGGAN
jgi:hypothetical protein